MLEAIDEEIARLERVRGLLSATNGRRVLNAATRSAGNIAQPAPKRVLSEEARNRIAQAQKRRWAKQHKETAAAAKKA